MVVRFVMKGIHAIISFVVDSHFAIVIVYDYILVTNSFIPAGGGVHLYPHDLVSPLPSDASE